jgi:hypothetical protein
VLVVDAVRTGRHPPGTVLSFPFEALGTEAGPSPHAVGLPTVIRLGRQSGVPLPSWIHIVAIEAEDMESFVEGLTPAVEAAVPEAVAAIRSCWRRYCPAGARLSRPPEIAPANHRTSLTMNADHGAMPSCPGCRAAVADALRARLSGATIGKLVQLRHRHPGSGARTAVVGVG